ncbi:hypothetical protein LZ198_18535 [Myxococcus sp. K15C18031901]|uniref:hypothetical protein n=1 Tax=Myxococcus dinghuensis TaxID=2906761 RepID=UPI0020A78E4F|nr:hypothetical protein [Myxococcus dinghuensis]MCP3100872.1 hypothetical protein [Myxococcus dinghuensis]
MLVRNASVAPRPSTTSRSEPPVSQTPAAKVAPTGLQVKDTFTQGTEALQRTARVGAAPAGDHGKLMREYLTGARPPPADFEKVMGYKPFAIQTGHGQRMQDPFGSASAPGKIGPDQEFDPAAKTHDYGYDLLRYYDRKGTPLSGDARKAADKLFREDLFHYANDQKGFGDRLKYRTWAQIYATAVELNSRVQGYGPP